MRRSFVGALFIVVGLFMASCGRPTGGEVRKAFLAENPTYTVLAVFPGEGDGSATYMHIKYRKPGYDCVCEDVWQYLKGENRGWSVNHKETLKP